MSDGAVNTDASGTGAQWAERLFAGEERWGWEYAEPPAPVPHHLADSPPVWVEPPGADARPQGRGKKSGNWTGCAYGLVVGIGIYLALRYGILALVLLLAVVLAPVAGNALARRAARRHRQRLWGEHQERVAHWQGLLAAHEAEERRRVAEAAVWFPVRLASQPSRVDVFGGTGNGWASLLATVGGPLLATGPLLVMDFSQQSVALELAALAAHREVEVSHVPLPSGFVAADLLHGFTPEELAECLAEALQSMRPEGSEIDLHSIDADLIGTAARALEAPVTYARLAAGLRVLLRTYEPGTDAEPLSAREVEALSRAVDRVGRGERVQNELRYVHGQMELMAKAPAQPAPHPGPAELWQPGRLTVLATDDVIDRRKDLTDRIVFFQFLHHVRQRRLTPGAGMLVIAGAERLGRAALESMARQARAAGIRLTLLFEHLREDTVRLVGGSDSATVFMRIGNGNEARDAARFIGQDHRFVVHQLTRQVGETFAEGRGSSYGEQDGESVSEGSGKGRFVAGDGLFTTVSGRGRATSRSFTTSLSRSWQETANTSTARSTTHGESLSRVYEFTVEPTQLQALPATGLVVVEAGPHGRRTVFADCNPGIAGLPRLSPVPRPALP
ncbi:hypothetical protein [Streptomyces sp. NPDC004267]|uniref:hypothetical protein n=1 Tax=Streptomyces sp. NPDC004267 TaxID=3364694 RepID=UPI0036AAC746